MLYGSYAKRNRESRKAQKVIRSHRRAQTNLVAASVSAVSGICAYVEDEVTEPESLAMHDDNLIRYWNPLATHNFYSELVKTKNLHLDLLSKIFSLLRKASRLPVYIVRTFP